MYNVPKDRNGLLVPGGALMAESKLKGQTRSIRMKAFLSWGQFFT